MFYDAMLSLECQRTFRRDALPLSSGLKQFREKNKHKGGSKQSLFLAVLFLGSFFNPEECDMLLRNVA